MVSKPPEHSIAGPLPERRPAIWPWLVMPLASLALFYALRDLKQTQVTPAFSGARSAVTTPADSAAP